MRNDDEALIHLDLASDVRDYCVLTNSTKDLSSNGGPNFDKASIKIGEKPVLIGISPSRPILCTSDELKKPFLSLA
jgi:hypothetical protein